LDRCPCKSDACAVLQAGPAKIETRCLAKHDTICGNESAFYPPLAKNVKVKAAVAAEHTFKGKGINDNWQEHGRRSAYVGSFEVRRISPSFLPLAAWPGRKRLHFSPSR